MISTPGGAAHFRRTLAKAAVLGARSLVSSLYADKSLMPRHVGGMKAPPDGAPTRNLKATWKNGDGN